MHLLIQETLVPSLDQEDSLEKEMATHSSVFTWGILWTEEPGGLRSMGVAKSQTWLSNTTTLSPHSCSFKSWERLKFHSELQTKTPVARVKSSTPGVGEGREDPDALPLHFLPVLPLLGCPPLLTSPYWPTFFFSELPVLTFSPAWQLMFISGTLPAPSRRPHMAETGGACSLHALSPKTVLPFLVISSCSIVGVTDLSVACGSWMFSTL